MVTVLIILGLFGQKLRVAVLSRPLSAFGDLSEKSLTDTTILEGFPHGLPVCVVGFIEVLKQMDFSGDGDFEGLVLGDDA